MKKLFISIWILIFTLLVGQAQNLVEPRKLPIYDNFGNFAQEQIFFDGGIGIIKGTKKGVVSGDYDFIATGTINRKINPLSIYIQLDYLENGNVHSSIAVSYDYTNEVKYFKKKDYPSDYEFILIKNVIITIKMGGRIDTYKGNLSACVKIAGFKTGFNVKEILDDKDSFMFDISYHDKLGNKKGWTIYTFFDGD
ncbi:MAG: hypothetical protein WCK78_01430 [Paludibacter sp.]